VRNFSIIRERVRDVVSVEDEPLLEALKFAMYRTKLVIEPNRGAGIAALMSRTIVLRGPVAIVVSGGTWISPCCVAESPECRMLNVECQKSDSTFNI